MKSLCRIVVIKLALTILVIEPRADVFCKDLEIEALVQKLLLKFN